MPSSVDHLTPPEAGPEAPAPSPIQVVGPAGFVLFLLLLATVSRGAFDVRQWAPPTLFALVALAALVLSGGGIPLARPWGVAALGGIWAFAGWSVLSATWAASPSDAVQGGLRDTLYAAVVTLPFVAIAHRRALQFAGAGVVVGIGGLAVVQLVGVLTDGPGAFLAGRLDDPIGYRNATALLFAMGFWPLVTTAAARGRGRLVPAVAFGCAVLCLGLAFLTQSRGVVLGLACGAAVSLGLPPDRVRRAWMAVLALGMLVLAARTLLTPYDAFAGGTGTVTDQDIATAAHALLALTGAAFVVGFLVATFDNGLRPHTGRQDGVRLVARLGLVALVVAGVAGAVVAVGSPVDELHARWDEFRGNQTIATGQTRLTNAGGQRYDLWRVALEEFRGSPLHGTGRDNYQYGYYRERSTDRNLDTAHSLPFEVAAELGVVGLALLAVFLVGIAGSLLAGWRRTPRADQQLAVALTAAGAVLLGQALVDWIWRIPGITSLGLFALATAAALVGRAEAPVRRPAPIPLVPRVALGGVLAVVALAVTSLYFSDHYLRQARGATTPEARAGAARTAARFNPLDVAPLFLQASALETRGDREGAIAKLRVAQRREPANVAILGLLGDAFARGEDFALAKRYYRRALALNPKDVGLQQLASTGGRPGSRAAPASG